MKKSDELKTEGFNLALQVGLNEFERWKQKQKIFAEMSVIEEKFLTAQKQEEAESDTNKTETSSAG